MIAQADQKRSEFVDILAWVMITISGLGLVMTAVQSTMLSVLLPSITAQLGLPGSALPPISKHWLYTLVILAIALNALQLWASWALLKRRKWARRTFEVGFFLAAILALLWVVGMLSLLVYVGPMLPTLEGEPGTDLILGFFKIMAIGGSIVAVTFAGLFYWLAKKLRSVAVKSEFQVDSTSVKTI